MNIKELLEQCIKAESQGLSTLVLKMPIPKTMLKRGYGGERVKTPFGLCRYTLSGRGDSLVIFPTLDQMRKYFAKIMPYLEQTEESDPQTPC